VTSDSRPESLAEQAAAWVPPWKRSPATAAPTPQDPDAGTPAGIGGRPPAGGGPERSEGTAGAPTAEDVPERSVRPAETPEEPGWPVETPEQPVAAASTDPAPADPAGTPATGTLEDPASPPAADARHDAADPGEQPGKLALIDDAELRGALEAILLVVDQPVTETVLAQVLEQPTERIAGLLERLARDYTAAGHGFELRRAAGGWRLYTRPEYAPYVERFVLDGQSVRLTQAALETLAVVAYKQPVTRSRISAIRGVNCDGVIRTLVSRGLVEECGTEPETGAHLYRTTTLFLEKLGLDSVDQLPPLAPFLPDDVEEIADAPR